MGGVIYIGDRETGKTSLALELTNRSNSCYVEVTSALMDYSILKKRLYDSNKGEMKPTGLDTTVYRETLEVKVKLSRGWKTISSFWLDTPGEIWRSSWKSNSANEDKWQTFIDFVQKAEGILLILPPYREIIDPHQDDPQKHITREQWIKRFDKWINFFRHDCPKIRHLLLCLNKIDLCLGEYEDEAAALAYNPDHQKMNWQEKNKYVFYRYFTPFHDQIDQLNRNIDGLSVRCFITTIKNRDLVELPWIYLGAHLGK